ncbi:MAG: hypothetical protein ACK502_09815 [Alphaproteobacteria bacterium]
MRNLVFYILVLLASTQVVYAAKDKNAFPMTTYEVDLIGKTDLPVMLVEVVSVPKGAWTNGNPPELALKIFDVLRGEKYPTQLTGIWRPLPYDTSWAEANEVKISDSWKVAPMEAPAVGSKWFITGTWDEQKRLLFISPIARYQESQAAFLALGEIITETFRNKNYVQAEPIITEAARTMRIEQWAKDMKASNAAALAEKSSLVAEVTLLEMMSKNRMVQFTITHIHKNTNSAATAPSTIKLMGLPDALYAILYDYRQSNAYKNSTFFVFMNSRESTTATGEKITVYAPVDARFSIQPVTAEALQALGAKTGK